MTNSSPNAYDDSYSHHQVAPPALPAHQYLSPSPTPTVNNDIEKKGNAFI
jgi:hypothetical protein